MTTRKHIKKARKSRKRKSLPSYVDVTNWKSSTHATPDQDTCRQRVKKAEKKKERRKEGGRKGNIT